MYLEEAREITKTPYIMVISEDEVKLYRKDRCLKVKAWWALYLEELQYDASGSLSYDVQFVA